MKKNVIPLVVLSEELKSKLKVELSKMDLENAKRERMYEH